MAAFIPRHFACHSIGLLMSLPMMSTTALCSSPAQRKPIADMPSPSPSPTGRGGKAGVPLISFPLSPGRGAEIAFSYFFPLSRWERVRVRGKRQANGLQNSIQIIQNLIIPKSHYLVTVSPKKIITVLIIFSIFDMLPSVHFNNQIRRLTHKICDIGTNRHLSTKLIAAQPSVSQPRPKEIFCICLALPQ